MSSSALDNLQMKPAARASARQRHRRRWLPSLGSLLLIGGLVAGLWPKPVPVEVATAKMGALLVTVNEEGKTRIKNRYVVSAPVAGQLRRIPFKAGTEVVSGKTVLAFIDPLQSNPLDPRTRSLNEARRETARANVEKAGVAHQFAVSELRRHQGLFSDKMISAQELEAFQLREAAALKDLAAAESALRQVEAELADFAPTTSLMVVGPPSREVVAPVTGKVLKVFEESARVVTPGMPLMEIGNPADLEVVVEVLSRDGAAVPTGARVYLEQWGGREPLEARVRLVEPAAFTKISALGVEEQRVNVVADLVTPPDLRTNVGDNFRVEARIVIWESDRTMEVPAGALFRHGEQWAVYRIQNGRAVLQIVSPGRSNGAETQLTSGISEGEQVILYPGSRVKAGQRVAIISI